MSLRAVKSPLAPKMTMAHGSTAFRPNSSRQVNNSSRWSVCSIDATQWRSRLRVSATLVARKRPKSRRLRTLCEQSPAIRQSGEIYVGCDNGKVYGVNSNGTLKWATDTGGGVRSSPTISGLLHREHLFLISGN